VTVRGSAPRHPDPPRPSLFWVLVVASLQGYLEAVKRRRLRATLIVTAIVAGIGIEAACSNQGEGEVCNSENGDEDCKTDEGLICWPKLQLNNTTSDRCCPSDRSTASHPACVNGSGIIGADAIAPADTGPSTITPDATVATDSGATDATTDADADAAQ
jgi:hypothetical protein